MPGSTSRYLIGSPPWQVIAEGIILIVVVLKTTGTSDCELARALAFDAGPATDIVGMRR